MKSQEVKRKITTYLKKNAFIIFTLLITLVAVIMLLFYYFHFKDIGLSDSTLDWANFGSYFGSITGLLAFAGVLYSINESKKQSKENDERNIFFKMLDLYQKKVESILRIKEQDGSDIYTLIQKYTTITIIYKYLAKEREFEILDKASREYVINGIAESVGVLPNAENFNEKLKKEIDQQLYLWHKIIIPEGYNNEYEKVAKDILYNFEKSNDYYWYCNEIMNYTSNFLFNQYQHILGQYFRNVYYLFEFAHNSSKPKFYGHFFRSQVSSPELTLMLYNALGKNSTHQVISYLNEFDYFNNIDTNNLILYGRNPNKKNPPNLETPSTFISGLFESYKRFRI